MSAAVFSIVRQQRLPEPATSSNDPLKGNAVSDLRLAINPLPWVLQRGVFKLDQPTLRTAFEAVSSLGFHAVQSDVPSDMSAMAYRRLLREFGLRPGPGYFAADLTERAAALSTINAARRHASIQAELGLDVVFIASGSSQERRQRPAVGAGFDQARLASITDLVGQLAEAIVSEGVYPLLHPHVGSWIETEAEVRHVLDATGGQLLGFGPDTGHLAWVGADSPALFRDYRERVRGIHLKDVDDTAVSRANASGADYWEATIDQHVWTEPGRGSVPLDQLLDILGEDADRWHVLEVDVPNSGSALESTRVSADWFRARGRFHSALSDAAG